MMNIFSFLINALNSMANMCHQDQKSVKIYRTKQGFTDPSSVCVCVCFLVMYEVQSKGLENLRHKMATSVKEKIIQKGIPYFVVEQLFYFISSPFGLYP